MYRIEENGHIRILRMEQEGPSYRALTLYADDQGCQKIVVLSQNGSVKEYAARQYTELDLPSAQALKAFLNKYLPRDPAAAWLPPDSLPPGEVS